MMYQKRTQKVGEVDMASVDEGTGDTIPLLQSNPSLSYIWRTSIADLRDRGRYLAPDLLGMADSASTCRSLARSGSPRIRRPVGTARSRV